MKALARRLALLLPLLALATAPTLAQFSTTRGAADELVGQVLKGPGIKVRGVKHIGHAESLAKFSNKAPQPAFREGVILSTGHAADATGPNENPKTSTALGTVGDRKLDAISKTRTFDAAGLEFEFMADKDSISLRLVFASEEYAEHVGSTFTDPIAITVTGPGLGNGKNLGLLPGTSNIPININSINISENKRWYIDNNPFTLAGKPNPARKAELDADVLSAFQYDGMTKPIEVGMRVTPREVYRIKIVIADAGDGNFDSALLLEAGSFRSLEQSRHAAARELARERMMADSLARAEAIADSIAEAETEEAKNAGIAIPQIESPDPASPGTTEVVEEDDDDDVLLEEPGSPDSPEASDAPLVEVDSDADLKDSIMIELDEPGGFAKEYRTVVLFEEDGYFVPEDQEPLLREYGMILKARSDYALGIFVPGASDEETTEMRYDMVRLEVIKAGAKPTQIYRMGVSEAGGVQEGEKVPKHRAELVLRQKN